MDPVTTPSGMAGLVARRKACRICVARDPDHIVSAASFPFDPPLVSHWAQWLGHPEPRLLIVGQDFSDAGYFERHRGVDDPNNATNRNLHALLTVAGFAPGPPSRRDPATPVHLTNAILCLKRPPMNRPISGRWVRACAEAHLGPLIDHLRPEAVVGLGSHGWRATRLALGPTEAPASIGAAAGGLWRIGGMTVGAVGHCGPLGIANRAWGLQVEDWRRIGSALGLPAPGGRDPGEG